MLNYITRANHAVQVYRVPGVDAGKVHKLWHSKSLPYDPQRPEHSYNDISILKGE